MTHRQKTLDKLLELLELYNKNSNHVNQSVSRKIERSFNNRAIDIATESKITPDYCNSKFLSIYNDICFRIISVINQDSIVIILSDKLDINKIAYISMNDLFPDINKVERELIALQRVQKIKPKYNSLYKCPNCRVYTIKTHKFSPRSLDEGGAVSAKCSICNKIYQV